ncbi:TonB-dependent receptor domain-containing protein [Elongatibacter sediminis]|uniref:TonB-dependent receptor n=1 Tax=Elongatibacter sediminis TaxID=3119006 RepID=A0AAW9RKS2_9GAMM
MVLLLVLASPPVGADDAAQPHELKPDLVITPGRAEQSIHRIVDAVSVITRADIERSAAEDLPDLLRLLPGVDVVRTGPAGAQTSVFLRGTNSNHVLVLVDGIRVSSTNTGAYAWELLPLDQIERIEVVRGPKASVWGSDAIGGVIQVFTRSRPQPYARLTVGSWDSTEFAGGWGASSERGRFNLSAGYRDSGGFSAQNPDGFGFDPDDDGLTAVNFGLNAAHDLGGGQLRLSVLASDTETDFDQGRSDAEQLLASLSYEGAFSPSWTHHLVAGYAGDRLESDFGFFTTGFRSERSEFAWQHAADLGAAGALRFGVDYTHEVGRDGVAFDERRSNTGVYAGFDRPVGRWLLQATARVDDNSEFGTEVTGQLGVGYDLTDSWQLAASWGSGFRGPNLNEQFSPGFGGLFAGNPELEPESSRSAEARLRWVNDASAFEVSVYRTRVDDLVAFEGEAFQAVNIARVDIKGVEAEYRYDAGPWRLRANATLQQAENRDSGADLLRRPDRKGSLTLDRRLGRHSWLGVEWFVSGKRQDVGSVTLPSYTLLNLRAGWQFLPQWRAELRADNLLDDDYEPAFGFNGASRSVFVSLAWIP